MQIDICFVPYPTDWKNSFDSNPGKQAPNFAIVSNLIEIKSTEISFIYMEIKNCDILKKNRHYMKKKYTSNTRKPKENDVEGRKLIKEVE